MIPLGMREIIELSPAAKDAQKALAYALWRPEQDHTVGELRAAIAVLYGADISSELERYSEAIRRSAYASAPSAYPPQELQQEPFDSWFKEGEECEYELYPGEWRPCTIQKVIVEPGQGIKYRALCIRLNGEVRTILATGHSLRKKDGTAARLARGEKV
jgi:hypothetical protein